MSEATARNGIGNLSKSVIDDALSVNLRNNRSSFCPWITPFGNSSSPPRRPSSSLIGNCSSSCLRRKLRSLRFGASVNTSTQSRDANSSSSSLALIPMAYRPPTTAPMLVPMIASIGIRKRSSSRSTPICAAPRAPPPPSTTPTFGRPLSGGGTSLALATNDEQIMKAIMAMRCRRSDKNRFIVRNSYLKTLSTMAQL